VTDYIATGEPVGSGTLASRHRIGVSAATIRNEMAHLEELGYLVQPHTSAGRIPTDLGYRFYVDSLPPPRPLGSRALQAVQDLFDEPPPDPDEAVLRAAALLSRLTGYGALSEAPHSDHVFVRGAANIAREAAFERRESVEALFEVLEEEATIIPFLRRLSRSATLVVRIGGENPLVAMREASLVVAPYLVRGRPAGTIAVIGPTRMHYPQTMSAVWALARRLSGVIEGLAG
jgi:transcriptional regulator of heat shock response